MKKFDRVTSILIYLQTKSVVTAKELADRFDVSERTVYRDLRSLEHAGVPISAEAGVGYFLDKAYRLPPVVFTREEGASLLVGAKMMESRADPATKAEYMMALDKIRSVMESEDQDYLNAIDDSIAVYKPRQDKHATKDNWISECRTALSRAQVIGLHYEAGKSRVSSERDVEPIGLYYYSNHWHLIAWCRLRADYRDFRLDRVKELELKPEQFMRREHASLQDYLNRASNQELHEIEVIFSWESARFVGEQRYFLGYIREFETDDGVTMIFVTPYIEYLGRWLLQYTSGARTNHRQLQTVMESLSSDLKSHWSAL